MDLIEKEAFLSLLFMSWYTLNERTKSSQQSKCAKKNHFYNLQSQANISQSVPFSFSHKSYFQSFLTVRLKILARVSYLA